MIANDARIGKLEKYKNPSIVESAWFNLQSAICNLQLI